MEITKISTAVGCFTLSFNVPTLGVAVVELVF